MKNTKNRGLTPLLGDTVLCPIQPRGFCDPEVDGTKEDRRADVKPRFERLAPERFKASSYTLKYTQ